MHCNDRLNATSSPTLKEQPQSDLQTLLVVTTYPRLLAYFGVVSMALFRIFLWRRQLHFWKLLGSGKNGGFSPLPDWHQWAILIVYRSSANQEDKQIPLRLLGGFINSYWRFFQCKVQWHVLQPVAAHGSWDGKTAFGPLPRQATTTGPIAVITRATIRLSQIRSFWKAVPAVEHVTYRSPGLQYSLGIGEWPWIRQATFSIWESEEAMKAFAYKHAAHASVIKDTRKKNWYSEEMFVRFRLLASGSQDYRKQQ